MILGTLVVFMSVKLAEKQYRTRVNLSTINYEKFFRVHLLQELEKIGKISKDPIDLTDLKRHIPSELFTKRSNKNGKMTPKDIILKEKIDFLFQTNNLFSPINRDELVTLYHDICSAHHIFSDTMKELKVDYFDIEAYFADLIRQNTILHNALNEIYVAEPVKEVAFEIPHKIRTEMVRTKSVLEEQIPQSADIHRKLRVQTLSALSSGIIEDNTLSIYTRLENHVKKSQQELAHKGFQPSEFSVEREMLMQKLRKIAEVKLPDITTLKRRLEDLNFEKGSLLDRKSVIHTQINQTQKQRYGKSGSSSAKDSEFSRIQKNADNLINIVKKNRMALRKTKKENKLLEDRLYSLNAQASNPSLFS